MPRKGTLILTSFIALIALVAGATGTYFFYSIPNDVKAEKLLRQARSDLEKKQPQKARTALETIVRDYPRTDAAAFASFGLFQMMAAENAKLRKDLEAQSKAHQRRLAALETRLQSQAAAAAAAAAKPPAAAAKPKPAAKPPARRVTRPTRRKAPPKKRTSTRRRRRAELQIPPQLRVAEYEVSSLS